MKKFALLAALLSTLAVAGAAGLANSLYVHGPATLCNTLAVSGAAGFSHTLVVHGHLKRTTCARGGFLEDQRDGLALQARPFGTGGRAVRTRDAAER